MEAIARRPLNVLSRRRMLTAATIALSSAITAAMSLLFFRSIRIEMMVTGVVCAVIVDQLIRRITRHYRRELAAAHASLERRVRERTEAIERLRDELLARDRMASAGMVAASVSHEIRSPLQVITMVTDELAASVDEPGLGQLARDARDATERIATIVRDLSSLARPVDDPLGPVELAGAIDSAARLAAYRFGPEVRLDKAIEDAPAVHGNGSRIVQVVMNLLINAARATGERPNTIRIATRAVAGDRVEIAVADTGTGMSEETRAKLFQPFFTTGRTTGGTGLGLSISRTLVERMGGTIAIESALGVGTTVRVVLRRADAVR